MKPSIFLHVPKTAGTTMRAILERQYSSEELYTVYDGAADHHSQKELEALTPEQQKKIKVYCGHFGFGVHRHLEGNLKYVTMLRDPVERVISYYHHAMTLAPRWKEKPVSLVKFIHGRKDVQLDNLQTRLISGVDAPFGKCSDEMVWTAIENIDRHFELVGLAEQFDESLVLLAEAFAWADPVYVRENIGKDRPPLDFYAASEINRLRNSNRYDLLLYAYAKRTFKKRLLSGGLELKGKLTQFLSANEAASTKISPRAVWA